MDFCQMEEFIEFLLLGVLLFAAIHDAKYRRIPNILTLSTILAGLVYHAWFSGFQGFLFSLGGAFLGMALLIIFYAMGKMGAGDVKLMGAVGSVLGPIGVFNAFLFTAIIGGIYAITILLYKGRFADSMNRMWQAMKLTFLTQSQVAPDEKNPAPVLCYGIAIALGTSLSLVF
jgi:prepilin peptidase CpaA